MTNPIDYWYQKYLAEKAKNEQMMKNSVECEYWDGSLFKNELREKFKDGDKVKIIIVKEE